MTISVCMGIYNGEKFIEKQLQTIMWQSYPANEVILCDDCSTDSSVDIVKRFIRDNKLENTWKLYQNAENKGYPDNFYYAMSLCTGDVVFLADQDDLWVNDKIKNMVRIMEADINIGVLSSRWGIIDEEDHVLKKISRGKLPVWEECRKVDIQDILYCNDWPGMCMCYRKDIGETMLNKIGKSKIPHDVALGMVAAEKDSYYCVEQINQYHRRHGANVAMEEHRVRKLLNKNRKLTEIKIYLAWLQEVLISKCLEKEENIEIIKRKKEIMSERLDNLENGCRMRIIKQYMRNKEDIRLATALCDVLIAKER